MPYDAAKHLIAKIGSEDKKEVMLKGRHVSLVAGANAIKRLWPKLDSWLGGRSALLRDHVRDVDGKTHDIVVHGHNIARFQAQLEAFGLPEATQP